MSAKSHLGSSLSRSFHRPQDRSGVLVLTLLVLVLISVIVLGLLASVTMERQSTEANYQQRRALSLAMMGFHTGVQQLREALGTGTNSWDNPYGNFMTNTPNFYWSVSPGMLTRFNYNNLNANNYALFSYTSDSLNTNLANLNRPIADGSYPIIGLSETAANATAPPALNVQFVNVLQDPTQGPGKSNPIVGRYAFWVDDESSKINVNVADGSHVKYSNDWMLNSLGLGQPTEEDMTVLSQGGANLTTTVAANIVASARSTSFHSPREILRASGVTADLYTNNVFDLTDDSRSPDINIFGQPKMSLIPILSDGLGGSRDMVINSVTLQPAVEIYPTPTQLPQYLVKNAVAAYGYQWNLWPVAMKADWHLNYIGNPNDGLGNGYYHGLYSPTVWDNGQLISYYMAGTNGCGIPITWPALPGINPVPPATNAGFVGKYTARQIDEIAIQIISFARLVSTDYNYISSADYPTLANVASQVDYDEIGYHFKNAPALWPGWLSNQFVEGLNRSQKIIGVGIRLAAWGPQGSLTVPPFGYEPPYLNMSTWVESWVPTAFRGGNMAYPNGLGSFNRDFGESANIDGLNITDWQQERNSSPWGAALYQLYPEPNGNQQEFWANQLLQNNQGIDFNANMDENWPDPDQYLAQKYHDPWALTNEAGQYGGTNAAGVPQYWGAMPVDYYYFPFIMQSPMGGEWPELGMDSAGQIRMSQDAMSMFAASNPQFGYAPYRMQTSAAGNNLVLSGGLAIGLMEENRQGSYSDPVPMEMIRGANWGGALEGGSSDPEITSTDVSEDGWWGPDGGTYSPFLTGGVIGDPNYPGGTGTNLWARCIASTIPVYVTLPVPSSLLDGPNVTNIYIHPTDPMVNKFPGDWIIDNVNNSSPALPPVAETSAQNGAGFEAFSEAPYLAKILANGGDPDSFWVPPMDGGVVNYKSQIAAQTLLPRSVRMPNIGYLNYLRTGVIPDDETLPYNYSTNFPASSTTLQHGTPWRLLSFGSVEGNVSSQTVHGVTYPDWALLDLVYVPTTLNAYGGPYANFTNLASFGTYGGATAGRINPNGCVIYTTNTSIPQANIVRLLPMQSTLYGLSVNQNINSSIDSPNLQPQVWPYKNGTSLDATVSATLASNIAQYISANGPLRMPAQICEIPAVAQLSAPENPLGTRNDLVRQMVGELTTQSNVYSVWTVGQVIQKLPSNSNYGEYEAGDQITGEVRLHLIVERYLDPGADGVYGNAKSAGPEGVVGTLGNYLDSTNHPYEPKFLYRVVRSEEVR